MRREVTPQPGFGLADFDALMASKQFVKAECFTITPTQGAIVRLTDLQEDVSIVGFNDVTRYTYFARQAVISGLQMRCTIGVEVDEQEVDVAYAADALFQNWKTWPESLLFGRLDGAFIARDWAVAPAWGAPWVAVTRMFYGLVSDLDSVGPSIAKIKVKSGLELLDVDMPKDVYSPICKNVFGDFRCGVDLNSLGVLGTVGPGATRTVIPWTGAGLSYAFGKLHISNGDTVTRVRTIRTADASNLYLTYPLDFDPGSGLQFTAYPGCTHLLTGTAGCQTYHPADFEDRFGGYPFVPVAETAF